MIFRFLILSDEVDDFRREIQIDSDATFLDFQKIITQSVDFKQEDMASFFICDNNWEKRQEITLVEMDTNSDEDVFIMEECILNDYLEDEKQKLMYVFDYMTERAFFIELREIITGKSLDKAICSKSVGNPPSQFVEFEDFSTTSNSFDIGENFYGDEGFDMDEIDREGFDGLESDTPTSEEDHL